MTYLDEKEISTIVEIFLDGVIEYDKVTRNYFLNGIGERYVSTFLKKSDDPIAQLKSDLHILNKKYKLPNNKIPLQLWLEAAERELKPVKHKVNFTELIKKVSAEDSKNVTGDENVPIIEVVSPEGIVKEFFNKYVNKKAVWSLIIGLSAVILLISLKAFFDQTDFGNRANIQAYEFLRSVLSNSRNQELPVVVLDISDLPPAPNGAVPPDKLQEIVDGLFESGAKAVAVNIKFTPRNDSANPEKSGLRHDDDFDFFDHLIEQRTKGNPVFLGVHQFDAEPETWLGMPEYKDLAADLTVCESKKCSTVSEILMWLKCGDYSKLYSIGKSLANVSENNPQPPNWLKPLLKDYEDEKNLVNTWLPNKNGDKIPCQRALMPVNYAKLEQMENSSIPAGTKEAVLQANNKFKSKIVIIGKAQLGASSANYEVIGRNEVVPGVFLTAMAANTLISDPIYKFKFWAAIVIDLLTGMILVFGLFIFRLWKGYNNESAQGAELIFLLSLSFLVLFSGVLTVGFYNILWLDFLLVIFAPFLYSKFENKVFAFLNDKV